MSTSTLRESTLEARPWRWPAIAAALVFIAVVVMCYSMDLYRFVGDDGGITLRYAERIAAGLGFNYNDGERVNGCSNPLYTLFVAGLIRSGLSLGEAATAAGAVSVALACSFAFLAFARHDSWVAALLGLAALLSFDYYFYLYFTGLESAFIPVFAAGLFLALREEKPWMIGLFLGLLFANKLDGALAALAFTAVSMVRERRFPLREALWAIVFAAPVMITLVLSFGSIFPNSMSTKLFEHENRDGFQRLWMHRHLMGETATIYVPALLTVVWAVLQRGRGWPTAIVVIQGWFVGALALFAIVDLGAPFPWYASAPQATSSLLATYGAYRLSNGLASLVRARGRWREVAVGGGLLAALGGLLAVNFETYAERHGPQTGGLPRHELSDLGRQAAGAWLAKHTDRTEWLAVAYGLPALEYGGPVYDAAGLNSHRDRQRLRQSEYLIVGPMPPEQPLRWIQGPRMLLGTFQYDASVGAYWLYGKGSSQIAKRGLRHLTLPMPGGAQELPDGWKRSTFRVALGDSSAIRLAAPAPPTLRFTAHSPLQSARFEILLDGVECYRAETSEDGAYHCVPLAAAPSPSNLQVKPYDITFRALPSAPGAPVRGIVIFDKVHLHVGDLLTGEDLRLKNRRRAARLDELASTGLPWQRYQP